MDQRKRHSGLGGYFPARQKLPAVIRHLIHATVEKPRLVQFPADEGIQRRGWDGRVDEMKMVVM